MPTCGAFTRSAVSHASGVKTPMAGLYSSIMAVLALSLLTPYFYFIPKATLASVLVIAVMFMVSGRVCAHTQSETLLIMRVAYHLQITDRSKSTGQFMEEESS